MFTIGVSVIRRDRATIKWEMFCRIYYSQQYSFEIHSDFFRFWDILKKKRNCNKSIDERF